MLPPSADYVAASNGDGEAVRAVITADRLPGSYDIITDSVLNWPNKFIATSGWLDPETGILDEETMTVFKGTLTGSIVTIEEFAPGYPDEGNFVGQVVVLKPSTLWADVVRAYLDELSAFAEASTHVALIKNDAVGGVVDGTNTLFTLSGEAITGTVELYLNGVRQNPGVGNDYTVAGTTINMAEAPPLGSVLLADYATSTSIYQDAVTGIVTNQVPTGAVDGSNTLFTTPSSYVAGSLEVWINGLKQIPGTHYTTTTPTTFTMSDAPATGDNIIVNYHHTLASLGDADTVDGYNVDPAGSPNNLYPLPATGKWPFSKITTLYGAFNRNNDYNIANATWANANVNTALIDTTGGGLWSISTPARITFPEDGIYSINIWLAWANSGAGTLRALRVLWNGGGDWRDISDYRSPVPYNNKNNIYLEVPVTAGEYFDMYCYQNSGGTLAIASAADYNTATKTTIRKVGEL